MRMSEFFLPTLKEDPSEAQIVSHRFMLRAGMIRQSSAGIYSWLPWDSGIEENRGYCPRGTGPRWMSGTTHAHHPVG